MYVRCTRTRATLSSTTSLESNLVEDRLAPGTAQAETGVQSASASSRLVPASDAEAIGLAKSFEDTTIFENVSFRIAEGEAVALVGANGTGKSTLLRCMLGLIQPSNGDVKILGDSVVGARPKVLRALRSRTGLVAQKHNLVPRLSVLTNVVHGLLGQQRSPRLWSQAFAPEEVRKKALGALEAVGLAHLADRRADRLSGGQSQRVAIARALVGKPKLLIADEPCASLDPSAGEEVMALFFRLVRQEGVTVIFTSHDIDHSLTYGDRVLGLADKQLKLDATAASLSKTDLRGLYD